MEFFARCAWGFEDVLADELRMLGAGRVRPLHGGVSFGTGLEDAYRACMWSRVATRIQLVLARVPAATADALYEAVLGQPWEAELREGATVAVRARGTNASLRNSAFVALKVKDGLCDRMREARGSRPDVDARRPDLEVDVAVHERRATLYLNLSGESLHRRGYREDGVQTEAPLKETLAASVVLAAGWQELALEGGAFVDPMCGSGTLAIEAAMIASHVAPGLLRGRWGFDGWARHDAALWRKIAADARDSREDPAGTHVLAGDVDASAVDIARANAERAGIAGLVDFFVADAAQLERHVRWMRRRGTRGLLATNPPYGKRLQTLGELPATYAALATAVEALPAGWEVAILTPDPGVDSALGRTPHTCIPCYNGPIETWVRRYGTDDAPKVVDVTSLSGRQRSVRVADEGSGQFAARLRKVARDASRAARHAGASCYRAFDGDLPGYDLAVDVYHPASGSSRTIVRVEELAEARGTRALRATQRLADAAALSAAVLDVPREDVVVVRPGEHPEVRRPVDVDEGPYRFEVNLASPRTGLPVEQRGVRELVGAMAAGCRVASLFATGAAALVHAMGSGAREGVLVDASRGHVDAARELVRANGLSLKGCRFACAGVPAWLARERNAHAAYDVVVLIAPAWLPARDAGGRTWDAAGDLVPLLDDVRRVLAPQGVVVLVPPRGLDVDVRDGRLAVEDASAQVGTRCLLVRHAHKAR